MNKTLPCPFCGSEKNKIWKCDTDPWMRIQCTDCLAIGPPSGEIPTQGETDGIIAWNNRVKNEKE